MLSGFGIPYLFRFENVVASIFIFSFPNLYISSNSIQEAILIYCQYRLQYYAHSKDILLGSEPCIILVPLLQAEMFSERNLLPQCHTLGLTCFLLQHMMFLFCFLKKHFYLLQHKIVIKPINFKLMFCYYILDLYENKSLDHLYNFLVYFY